MAGIETSLGGRHEAFPETSWGSVVSGRGARRETLDRLCSLYWRPVYRMIRVAHRAPVEEAKDLTQAFFCRLLEDEDFVARYRPEQGRFRTFLKGALSHFLADVRREGARLRRGGDKAILPLDVATLETGEFLSDPSAPTPEALFDQQWTRDVMAHTLERLRTMLLAEGKEGMLRVYEAYELEAGEASYGDLAKRFGISEAQVTNHLHHARARFRELLVEQVSAGVSTREELEQELRDLFSTP